MIPGSNKFFRLLTAILISVCICSTGCQGGKGSPGTAINDSDKKDSETEKYSGEEFPSVFALLVLPRHPLPGEPFRILATGGTSTQKTHIVLEGPSGRIESEKNTAAKELPFWRLDDFGGLVEGKYRVVLTDKGKEVAELKFEISKVSESPGSGGVWKTQRGWDSSAEALYSAWINALFQGCNEQSSWPALHAVTRDRKLNFLYNYLSLGEDDPGSRISVVMQPDCADNPFFFRAYFAWKLGLPFGYHVCDRGYVHHNPRAGQWVNNETAVHQSDPVAAFNSFLRRIADGVHSGTGRTALDDENSDYYPVALSRGTLRPGTVFADPYGHTLILTGWISQTGNSPGLLLAVDAQPDGTVGIKRFWKGNFMFNTTDVVGEPGFKAFRPITVRDGELILMPDRALKESEGFIPFSMEQKNMGADTFYHTMERLINPTPLDPEAALTDQIQALYEQLIVRITSVSNGDAYLRSHPGIVIPMPTSANGIFLAGGQWENFSTPNRDLRLLIAMDAVLGFPAMVAGSPRDFKISGNLSAGELKEKLQTILDQKVSQLTISYSRSDGSTQKLTLGEILERREAFEMAYNPNDGIEIRWGAPENSSERSTCRHHAPAGQMETMRMVRPWFHKRLHPPT
jgi:hypothetical protein